ncbi:ATP-binding protein [Actinacidiphila alni]|uniref:ATP-binding protein n=1 Tax=Actinacidiphila alni TaxID=380248 RepID=UPI0033D06488
MPCSTSSGSSRATPPGVTATPYGFLVPADEAEVAASRRTVVEAVRNWQVPLPDEAFDDLALLTTEVVTNAVRHTRAACAVAVRWTGAHVRVEVTDVEPRRPVLHERCLDAEDGRGLLLVESLSAGWGSEEAPAEKIVWFEVGPSSAELVTLPRPSAAREGCAGATPLAGTSLNDLLALARGGVRSLRDADRWVRCALERHAPDISHAGLVLDSRSLGKSAVWLRWPGGSDHSGLAVLADCTAVDPRGSDGCCSFDGHSGCHSWELADAG